MSTVRQNIRGRHGRSHRAGFTLLEMIVAMAVVAAAMTVVVQAMARVQSTWVTTSAKVREAQDARAGMETLSRTIPRATLDPHWSMDDKDAPKYLVRSSDLHFVCGPAADLLSEPGNITGHAIFFQAPNGYAGSDDRTTTTPAAEKAQYDTLPNVLNAWGYFVEFGEDPAKLPAFLSGSRRAQGLAPLRHRFRLMEFRQPAHELELFEMTGGGLPGTKLSSVTSKTDLYKWFSAPLAETAPSGKRRCAVITDNILALVIHPVRQRDPASAFTTAQFGPDPADEYLYDSRRYQWDAGNPKAAPSRHRLPSAVQISLIVLDERDWSKLTDQEALRTGNELRTQVSQKFSKPANFTSDMGSLTGELNRRKMRHRVITTTLQIPGGTGTTDRDSSQP